MRSTRSELQQVKCAACTLVVDWLTDFDFDFAVTSKCWLERTAVENGTPMSTQETQARFQGASLPLETSLNKFFPRY